MKHIIREYHQIDFLRCCEIHDAARPIELKGSCDAKAFVPLQEEREDLSEFKAADKFVACAETNGNTGSLSAIPLGFVGITENTISWLYVEPKHFRRGIARSLLNYGLEQIDGPANVYVLDGNAAAKQLYFDFGFVLERSMITDTQGYACKLLKLSQAA